MDEQYAYHNEGRYYASLTFFLTITGILIVFYNWSKYLERKEALKSFEKIIEDEKKKKDILAKHGLENLSDKKHSFHGLYNVNTLIQRPIFLCLVILIGLAICYGIRYINNNVKNKEKKT